MDSLSLFAKERQTDRKFIAFFRHLRTLKDIIYIARLYKKHMCIFNRNINSLYLYYIFIIEITKRSLNTGNRLLNTYHHLHDLINRNKEKK